MTASSPATHQKLWVALCLMLLALAPFSAGQDDEKNKLLVIVKDGKYGYIDHSGKIIIQPQFIWAEDFWRGLGEAYVCGRYVSIDASGNFHPLRITVEGQLERHREGDKYGFVDSQGQFKITPTFDDALPFSGGLAAVKIGDKWGFIDASGQFVIQPRFDSAYYFREGLTSAELESKDVLIDKTGKLLASGLKSFDLISDGRVPVWGDEKAGFLDLQGNVAIPLVYDEVRRFSGGLAAVRKADKWGYVERDGRMAIDLQFDTAGPFGSGLAPVTLGQHTGFIDKSGRFALELPFREAPGFFTGDSESGLFIADSDVSRFWTTDDKFGYVNTSGQVIWGPISGSPDHPPLLGWTEEDNDASCRGIPQSIRKKMAGFPQR